LQSCCKNFTALSSSVFENNKIFQKPFFQLKKSRVRFTWQLDFPLSFSSPQNTRPRRVGRQSLLLMLARGDGPSQNELGLRLALEIVICMYTILIYTNIGIWGAAVAQR
jgi:hypothetical protein